MSAGTDGLGIGDAIRRMRRTRPDSQGKDSPALAEKREFTDGKREEIDKGITDQPWMHATRNVQVEPGTRFPMTASARARELAALRRRLEPQVEDAAKDPDDTFLDYEGRKDDPHYRRYKALRDWGEGEDFIALQAPGTNEELQNDVGTAIKYIGRSKGGRSMFGRKKDIGMFQTVDTPIGPGTVTAIERRGGIRMAQVRGQWFPIRRLKVQAGTAAINWESRDPFILQVAQEAMDAMVLGGRRWPDVRDGVVKRFKLNEREKALLHCYLRDLGYGTTEEEMFDPMGTWGEQKNIFASIRGRMRRMVGKDHPEDVQGELDALMLGDPVLKMARSDLRQVGELELVATSEGEVASQVAIVLEQLKRMPERYASAEDLSDVAEASRKLVEFAQARGIRVPAGIAVEARAKAARSTDQDFVRMVARVNEMNDSLARIKSFGGKMREALVRDAYVKLEPIAERIGVLTTRAKEGDERLAQVVHILGVVTADLARALRELDAYYKPYDGHQEIDVLELPATRAQQRVSLRSVLGGAITRATSSMGDLEVLLRERE